MKYTKRILALLLALCMVFTSTQLPVRAEEDSAIETLEEGLSETGLISEESESGDLETEDSEEDVLEEEEGKQETEESSEEDEQETEEPSEEGEQEVDEPSEEGEQETEEPSEEAEQETEESSEETEQEAEEPSEEAEQETEGSSEEAEQETDKPSQEEPVKEKRKSVSYARGTYALARKTVVDAAIFFSDLHSMKNGDSTEGSNGYKKDVVTNIMTALKNTGLTFSSVTSVGDAFSSNDTANTGKTSIITGYIRNALENQNVSVNYAWSDHDRAALAENDKDLLENKSGLIYGAGNDGIYGNEDDGNYYIYAISMSDTSSSERYGQPSTFTTQKLQDFKDAVKDLDNTKPLFIASHQPLLARRSDNQYAYQWCTVINEVAKERDVAFFFGHNHNYDKNTDYYYEKGETMTVQDGSSTKAVELEFTHMCTGYLDPATTGYAGSSRQGTVMLVTMYDDSINFTTYNKDGKFTGTNAVDQTIERAFASAGETPDPENPGITDPETPVDPDEPVNPDQPTNPDDSGEQTQGTAADTATKTTLSAPGVTGVTVTKSSWNPYPKIYKAYAKYDINPDGYTDGTEATVSIELDNSFSRNGQVIVFDVENQTSSVQSVVNRVVTFTTNHFSEYDVAEAIERASLVGTGVLNEEKPVQITQKEELINGNPYVLVSNTGNGTLTKDKDETNSNRLNLVDNTVIDHRWYYENDGFYCYDNNQIKWLSIETNKASLENNKDGANVVSTVTESSVFGGQDSVEGTFILSNKKNVYLNKYGYANDGIAWGAHGYGSVDENSNWRIYKIVKPQVTLSVTPSAIRLVGTETTFNLASIIGVTVDNETASSRTISYSSDKTNIVTVSNEGVLIPRAQGTATITVTLSKANGKNLEESIHVDIPVTVVGVESVVLDDYEGTVSTNSPESTRTGSKIIITYTDKTTEKIPVTLDMLSNSSGTELNVTQAGEYSGLTVTYGNCIIEGYTLNVVDEYGIEITQGTANEVVDHTVIVKNVVQDLTRDFGYKGTKNGAIAQFDDNKITWTTSDSAIATVDQNGTVTFHGEEGVVRITVVYNTPGEENVTDSILISVSKDSYVVPEDGTDDFPEYPNQGSVRFDKTASAVGNFSETGIAKVELSMTGVPYTTNNVLDVVLMLDHSNSMEEPRMAATREATKVFIRNIVINEDGSFNKNRIYIGSFQGGNPQYANEDRHKFKINVMTVDEQSGYQIIDNQSELDALLETIDREYVKYDSNKAPYGTEYAQSLKRCYELLRDTKAEGHSQACVFMSDGIPNVYQYGANENDKTTSSREMAKMFTGTDYNTRANNYKYEYYSTLMKANDVTVYSVGLGLKGTNSSLGNATAVQCENAASLLLNDISGPAGETAAQRDTGTTKSKLDTYFFSVADADAADEMKNVFRGISQKIMEAAKDVVVEDKIGNDYSVNFKLPQGVGSDATDGLEEFYIQVVEYALDATTHERTGAYTVLENFTFNKSGALKSHTVNGAACASTNCSHVTATNGEITAINGTYFDYSSDSTGEYLNWQAEKLTSNELALQYFAYLDDSAGTNLEHQTPAGTYYTNEYATLTYTNVNGNAVQQEFPVPQMTWNGAQVSYVFYLVNDAGQPVNKAGRVVPFAEATYITDTYTTSIVWNDMEQSAGLEAKILANELVPDVFALYDDDASYNIHVYEDESEVNLNNHFVIKGDVNDDYNTVTNSWRNAKTTIVFNNKSDDSKYNTVGVYVANDKDGTNNEKNMSYFCKSAPIKGATYTSKVENGITIYKVTDLGEGYKTVAGETQATFEQIKAAGGTNTYGTRIGDYIYHVDEEGNVYTIVTKTDGIEVGRGFDYSNTTVAFAVVWRPELVADTVVIDYGLDVVIDVIANDAMAAGVTGVMLAAPEYVETDGTYDDAVGSNLVTSNDGVWTASKENLTSVRFHLNNMRLNSPQTFYYEASVNYYTNGSNNATLQTTNMYSSVTVIPATTIYYEDTEVFVTYKDSSVGKDDADYSFGKWTVDGTEDRNSTQAQDRPGADKLSSALDADNVYGYDGTYLKCDTYSLGSAHKVTVSSAEASDWPTATFTFTGTAFDIISLTSKDTGTITVNIDGTTESGQTYKRTLIVDTFYGYEFVKNSPKQYLKYTFIYGSDDRWHVYTAEEVAEKLATEDEMLVPASPKAGDTFVSYELNGSWRTTSATENSLYQIPVIRSPELEYGTYKVTIMPRYAKAFDHMKDSQEDNSYDFYLDAIRIYNPAKNSVIANNAYSQDNEAFPEYVEIRMNLLEQNAFGNVKKDTVETETGETEEVFVEGAVFIDGFGEEGTIAEYGKYGPNNEVYLKKNQAVAFRLTNTNWSNFKAAHLGIKAPMGGAGSVAVAALDDNYEEIKSKTISTSSATELYYDITECVQGFEDRNVSKVIVIKNNSDTMISLTNVKLTHEAMQTVGWSFRMSRESALLAARYVTDSYVEEIPVEEIEDPADTSNPGNDSTDKTENDDISKPNNDVSKPKEDMSTTDDKSTIENVVEKENVVIIDSIAENSSTDTNSSNANNSNNTNGINNTFSSNNKVEDSRNDRDSMDDSENVVVEEITVVEDEADKEEESMKSGNESTEFNVGVASIVITVSAIVAGIFVFLCKKRFGGEE